MEPHFWQLVIAMSTMCFGAVIGVGCNQSGQQPTEKNASKNPDDATVAQPVKIQRYGSVIGLRSEKKDYYEKLHANPWPEINAMIKKCNIQNYTIYETELDGKLYLFSYFEYVGDDFAADMAKMAADPKTQEWWEECKPCQIRLPGTPDDEQWKSIPAVYHLD